MIPAADDPEQIRIGRIQRNIPAQPGPLTNFFLKTQNTGTVRCNTHIPHTPQGFHLIRQGKEVPNQQRFTSGEPDFIDALCNQIFYDVQQARQIQTRVRRQKRQRPVLANAVTAAEIAAIGQRNPQIRVPAPKMIC